MNIMDVIQVCHAAAAAAAAAAATATTTFSIISPTLLPAAIFEKAAVVAAFA